MKKLAPADFMARVIDQDRDVTPAFGQAGGQCINGHIVRNIEFMCQNLARCIIRHGVQRFSPAAADDNPASHLAQRQRDGTPDARSRTGDQCRLPRYIHASSPFRKPFNRSY